MLRAGETGKYIVIHKTEQGTCLKGDTKAAGM